MAGLQSLRNDSFNSGDFIMKNKLISFLFFLMSLLLVACNSDDPIKRRQKNVSRLYSKGSVKIAVEQSDEVSNNQLMNALHLAQKKIKEEKWQQ